MKKDKNTIVVCRFSALGDVAMTIPVLYSTARQNPDMRFVLLTKKALTELFVNAPDNLTIEGIDLKNGRYSSRFGMVWLYRAMRRKYSFGRYADLHSVLRSRNFGACCRWCGIKMSRIDKGRKEKRALTTQKGNKNNRLRTSFERYADVFAKLGIPTGDNFTTLYPDGVDDRKYAAISQPKKDGERWIGVAPFAAHNNKILPLPITKAIVEHFAKDDRNRIFLFGGGDTEREILAQWAKDHDNIVSVAEQRYGFPAELALQSRLDVMFAMDSANMHLAALAGTQVVSVWGATHPVCGFAPWRQPDDNAIGLDMECRPCSVYGNRPCRFGDLRCLNNINPETIIKKIEQLLYE